jgi:hypothetical protein
MTINDRFSMTLIKGNLELALRLFSCTTATNTAMTK